MEVISNGDGDYGDGDGDGDGDGNDELMYNENITHPVLKFFDRMFAQNLG